MHQKNNRYDSPPMYSPSNARTSRYQQLDYTSEQKLSEKIHKLKHALKKSQSHNEQMHSKVKFYRDLHEYQARQLKDQLKKYKKKYAHLQIQFGKKLQELQQIKIKSQYEDRQTLTTLNEKINKIRSFEGRIIELQAKNIELSSKINQKNLKIKSLQSVIDKIRGQDHQKNNQKLEKLQKQLLLKTRQCSQMLREVSAIKDINKQLTRKIQKGNMAINQQAQHNKQTLQQNKQIKKDLHSANKQIIDLKQTISREKIHYQQKIASLEKMVIQKQFQKQKLADKLNQQTLKSQKLNKEVEQLVLSYRDIEGKYTQLLQSQIETQKQFQRQFNVIAKQMARRHLIAKSIKGSTTPSSHASGSKKGLPYFNIQSNPYDERDCHQGFHLKKY